MSTFRYIRDEMGYKERSTYIELLVTIGVFIWYLTVIAGRFQPDAVADIAFQGPLIRAVIISVVATIVLHVLYGIFTGNKDTTEDLRDRQVSRFGDWVGMWPLIIGTLFALGMSMLEREHFWIANFIYAGFVASSVTNSVSRLIAYRRGLGLA